ncbi:hypothetical protein [Dictyobacter formicarum]|uniref:Uncharacterized protein n=1 Tax=Dictyobacter formicarum TaxID=2778368 RepID=A0ABQ3VGJ0_9CHLR|nr:hypothetical protein [Dictyobacter formicarum]GHO84928.1 hypothetical protein KSZ_29340 [Dictyobacter formicarum]
MNTVLVEAHYRPWQRHHEPAQPCLECGYPACCEIDHYFDIIEAIDRASRWTNVSEQRITQLAAACVARKQAEGTYTITTTTAWCWEHFCHQAQRHLLISTPEDILTPLRTTQGGILLWHPTRDLHNPCCYIHSAPLTKPMAAVLQGVASLEKV